MLGGNIYGIFGVRFFCSVYVDFLVMRILAHRNSGYHVQGPLPDSVSSHGTCQAKSGHLIVKAM